MDERARSTDGQDSTLRSTHTMEKVKPLDPRKQEEIEFHNKIRGVEVAGDAAEYEYYHSNKKFYAIDRANRSLCERWLRERVQGKEVLDYCCGEGEYALAAARYGGRVTGIDLSDVSVDICRREAERQGVTESTRFLVMDAEQLEFDDDSFDYIVCAGVLHHLDLPRAYAELARVLRPGGEILCMEPLKHNPIIQWYRNRTPHLRTEFEAQHILSRSDLELARRFFGRVDYSFFHLATLAAVPFRNLPGFRALLGALEAVDRVILSIPGFRWMAWITVFVLADPRRKPIAG